MDIAVLDPNNLSHQKKDGKQQQKEKWREKGFRIRNSPPLRYAYSADKAVFRCFFVFLFFYFMAILRKALETVFPCCF